MFEFVSKEVVESVRGLLAANPWGQQAPLIGQNWTTSSSWDKQSEQVEGARALRVRVRVRVRGGVNPFAVQKHSLASLLLCTFVPSSSLPPPASFINQRQSCRDLWQVGLNIDKKKTVHTLIRRLLQ